MPTNAEDIARSYERGELKGWKETVEPGSVAIAHAALPKLRWAPPIFNEYEKYRGTKTMLYDVTRKVLGKDTENVNQAIGDCVSWSARNTSQFTSCCDILIRREAEKWRPIFPPYYYGTGRVYVGQWENSYSDGSIGAYMAEAVVKYGTLFSDEPGCPAYSGNVAKEFGAKRATLDKWKPKAIEFPIQDVVQIKSWQELVCALANYYCVSTCSDVGYKLTANSDGFHSRSGSWSHAMTIIGYKDDDKDPYAVILNSWGPDIHGILKDFDGGPDLPGGCLRVRRKDIESHIKANETYAYCNLKGAPGQRERVQKELFKLF